MDGPDPHDTSAVTLRVMKLLADYARHVDARAAEAWADLFTDEGAMVLGERRIAGHADLAAFASGSPEGVHVSGIPSVELGPDRIVARSRFIFLAASDGQVLAGSYTDTVDDDGARARFVERSIEMTVRLTVPVATAPAAR